MCGAESNALFVKMNEQGQGYTESGRRGSQETLLRTYFYVIILGVLKMKMLYLLPGAEVFQLTPP